MNSRLIFLALCFIGNTALSAQCVAPAPFKELVPEEANSYQIKAIMDETKPIIKSEANADNEKQNTPTVAQIKVVNFWASWCKPCRAELPLLDQLKADNIADVQLVNIGDSEETVKRLLSELKITHSTVRLAEGDLLSKLSLVGLPATLVWANDKIVFRGMGKLRDEKAIKTWLSCLKK